MPVVLGFLVAGAVVGVVGQVKAGRAAKKASEVQAAAQVEAGKAGQEVSVAEANLAEYNANVSELQAQDALARGVEDEGKFRQQVRGMIGSQRAGQAAQNTDVSFGSTVDVQADTAYLGEQDALNIRTNAAREAWGFKVQSQDYLTRAMIARKEGAYRLKTGGEAAKASLAAGSAAKTAAYYGAASTAISTGGSMAMMAKGYGTTKIP